MHVMLLELAVRRLKLLQLQQKLLLVVADDSVEGRHLLLVHCAHACKHGVLTACSLPPAALKLGHLMLQLLHKRVVSLHLHLKGAVVVLKLANAQVFVGNGFCLCRNAALQCLHTVVA